MTAPANARPSGAIVIACVALTISGVAIGFLIGRITAASAVAARSDEAPGRRADDTALIAAIQDLKDTVQRQPLGIREPIQAAGDGHAAPVMSSEQIEKLTASVERLNGLVEGRNKSVERLRSDRLAWEGPGFPSVTAMLDRVRFWRLSQDPQWREKLENELKEAHGFWSRDEVLDRYGRPAELTSGGANLNLVYSREIDSNTSEFVEFQVADGYVHKVVAE